MSGTRSERSILQVVLDAEHQRIGDLARKAEAAAPAADDPRLRRRLGDSFSAVLSQHLAAVDDVLLAEAKRRLPAGLEWVRYYVRHTRSLELALHRLKAWLYGDATTTHAGWDGFWQDMRAMLDDHERLESTMTHGLQLSRDEEAALAERLRMAQETSPTRPHPFTPHTGVLGRMAHRLWRVADGFWDHAEGRVVPRRPAKLPSHPDSLVHRYFTGAPEHHEESSP